MFVLSLSNAVAQETYATYNLKPPVKELTIKVYKAEEVDGELTKGRLWDSKIPSDGTRFVEFDELGNVTRVSSINCNTLATSLWYSFERNDNKIIRTNFSYKGEIHNVETSFLKDEKLHKQYLTVNNEISLNANKHINCHEEYFYDSLGSLKKVLKYDENNGVVAIHEMVSRDKSNTLIEELIIDCTPYMNKIFNPKNHPQYEREHKNILYSIFRKYGAEGRLKLMYDDSKRHLKEFDKDGKLLRWSNVDLDHETIKSSSTYIYLDNGLLSQKVRNVDGVETILDEYTYTYNDRGDWISCDKKSGKRSYIYEREIVYW
ncbi:MAG: hypothetical protein ACJATI_001520 [Halioglobus sp.]|jgi:hypothetical protein